MNTVLAIFGAVGGLGVFGGAAWAIIRAIFRQIGATEANTDALNRLSGKVDSLDGTVDDLRIRVARLEGGRQ